MPKTKKTLSILLLCALLLFTFGSFSIAAGQSETSDTGEIPAPTSPSPFPETDLSETILLSLSSESYLQSDPILTYTLTNESARRFGVGQEWALEIRQNDEWRYIDYKENTAFTSSSTAIPEDEPISDTLDLSALYDSLPLGHYRLIKPLDETTYAAAEFDLVEFFEETPIE